MRNNAETRYLRIEPALKPSPSEAVAALKLDEPVTGIYPTQAYTLIAEKLRHSKIGGSVSFRREFRHGSSTPQVFDVVVYRGVERPENTISTRAPDTLRLVHTAKQNGGKELWRVYKGEISERFKGYTGDRDYREKHPNKPVEDIALIRGGYTPEDFELRTFSRSGDREGREQLARASVLYHSSPGRDRDLVMIAYDNGMPVAAVEGSDISTNATPATVETGFDVATDRRGAGLSETMLFDMGGIAKEMFGARHMHLEHRKSNGPMGHIADTCIPRGIESGEIPWGTVRIRINPDEYDNKLVDIDMRRAQGPSPKVSDGR